MRAHWIAVAAALVFAGCGGSGIGSTGPAPFVPAPSSSPQSTGKITHVVLMIQENRTLNDLFAGFPGATTSMTGVELVGTGTAQYPLRIKLTKHALEATVDFVHLYADFLTAYQNGNMDGFNLNRFIRSGKQEGTGPYQYVDPTQIVPYRTIADQWGLADEMFQTQGSDSFTAHQDLIRGGTFVDANDSLIDPPTSPFAWGCDAAHGSKTTLITKQLQYLKNKGPFPCSNQFPDYGSNGYETLRDLFDAASLSWKYYAPQFQKGQPNGLWNAFDLIAPVRYGSEWTNNISSPETNILSDISKGNLPAMSWVIPDAQSSDHPGYSKKDTGPSWVASVVNAIGKSGYWDSTIVIVVWDDWGGFYDPVAPPQPLDDQGGPGFRVPMLVVSPYVKKGGGSQGGYVSHTVYEFGSIIRFIEDTFKLPRLGTTDSTCKSMADMLNLKQPPRKFVTIPSKLGDRYFRHMRPSGLPVDTE